MSFKPLSLSAKTRHITGITTFSGLDAMTQRFKVSEGRAIDMKNFIYKDGVIQKREGVEELFNMEKTRYIPYPFDGKIGILSEDDYKVNETNFNGIWTVKGEDELTHIIAHIGKLLYEIKEIEKDSISIEPICVVEKTITHNGYIHVQAYEFENYKSSAFVGSNRLYFLGGNKYMCLKFQKDMNGNTIRTLYPIEDDIDTFIPTTTTSITYKNSLIAGRSNLDKVNLLTQWRKNEMISGTLKNEDDKTKTEYYDYTLDAPMIFKNENDMSDVLIILEEGGTIE